MMLNEKDGKLPIQELQLFLKETSEKLLEY